MTGPLRVALMGFVRGETPWLLEWIAHAQAVGFAKIAIASDPGLAGTGRLLDRLSARGILHHERLFASHGGIVPLFSAFARLRRLPQIAGSHLLMALDPDEFLVIQSGAGRLDDLLARLPDGADMALIARRRFGDSQHRGWVPRLAEGFTWAEAPETRPSEVRALIRAHHRVLFYGAHVPRDADAGGAGLLSFRTVDATGRALPGGDQTRMGTLRTVRGRAQAWEAAQINHYTALTPEMRALTPDPDSDPEIFNEVEDQSIARTAEPREAALAALLADAETAALSDALRAEAQDRIAALEEGTPP